MTSSSSSFVPPPSFIIVLATIVALGPLSIDLYLPALPGMVVDLKTSISQVQLTLSAYLLGFAIFHLVCGPLSDYFGRKTVLIGGMGLYAIASLFCANAATIEELIIWRFIQAMGACCAPTIGRAIVRDVYPSSQSSKMLAYLSSLMAIAPVIAPSFGGLILKFYDWRIMFVFLAIYACILIIIIWRMPETLPHQNSIRLPHIFANYLELIRHARFRRYIFSASALYAGAFAFLSGASFIMIDMFNVSPQHFGAYFMCMVVGYIAGNLFTARLGHRFNSEHLIIAGLALGFLGGLIMLIAFYLRIYSPFSIVIPMMIYTAGIGITLPEAMAQALKPFASMAATASALMGFLQMLFASIAGYIVGVCLTDEPMPLGIVMMACGTLGLVFYFLQADKPSSHAS